MVERTGRHLGDDRGKADGPALGDEYTVHSSRFSRAQYCTEIVRILHSIEKDKKRWLASLLCSLKNGLHTAIGFRRHKCDDALVLSAWHQAVECRLGLDMNRNLLRSRQLNDIGELSISSKDQQSLQRANTGAECLPNGVQPIQQVW